MYGSVGLTKRGRGTYEEDKLPVFTPIDRGTDYQYVIPAKSADELTVRLLLADHEEELIAVNIDGFQACDSLEDNNAYQRNVVQGDDEYVDDIYVKTCESYSRNSDRGSRLTRHLKERTDAIPPDIPASTSDLPQIRMKAAETDPSNVF